MSSKPSRQPEQIKKYGRNRRHSSPTLQEVRAFNTLKSPDQKERRQYYDAHHIINLGRAHAVNPSVLSDKTTKKRFGEEAKEPMNEKELQQFIQYAKAYDPQTGLHHIEDATLVRSRESMIQAIRVYSDPYIIHRVGSFGTHAQRAFLLLLEAHNAFEEAEMLTEEKDVPSPEPKRGRFNRLQGKLLHSERYREVKKHLKILNNLRNSMEHDLETIIDQERKVSGLAGDLIKDYNALIIDFFDAGLKVPESVIPSFHASDQLLLIVSDKNKSAESVFISESSSEDDKYNAIRDDILYPDKPTVVISRVNNEVASNRQLTILSHAFAAMHYYKIRPASNGDISKADSTYCKGYALQKSPQYRYSEKWIQRLCEMLNSKEAVDFFDQYKQHNTSKKSHKPK